MLNYIHFIKFDSETPAEDFVKDIVSEPWDILLGSGWTGSGYTVRLQLLRKCRLTEGDNGEPSGLWCSFGLEMQRSHGEVNHSAFGMLFENVLYIEKMYNGYLVRYRDGHAVTFTKRDR